MSSYRQRPRQEIGSVLKSRDVKNLKLSLLDAVFEPMKTHVDGLRHFRGEDVIGQTHRALIVAVDGCWRLGMPHVVEDPSFVISDSGSGKNSRVFSLCYKRTNNGYAGRMYGYGVVMKGVRRDWVKMGRGAEKVY